MCVSDHEIKQNSRKPERRISSSYSTSQYMVSVLFYAAKNTQNQRFEVFTSECEFCYELLRLITEAGKIIKLYAAV